MRYKATAQVDGEAKARTVFSQNRRAIYDWVSATLAQVPVGTVVSVYVVEERLDGQFTKTVRGDNDVARVDVSPPASSTGGVL